MDGVHVHRFRYFFQQFETLANVDGFLPALKAAPWCAFLPPFFFAEVWAIGRLARRHHAKLIHAHWVVPQEFAAWLTSKLWRVDVPVILTCHGADLFALNGKLLRFLKRIALKRAAAVTVVSQAGQKQQYSRTRSQIDYLSAQWT